MKKAPDDQPGGALVLPLLMLAGGAGAAVYLASRRAKPTGSREPAKPRTSAWDQMGERLDDALESAKEKDPDLWDWAEDNVG